MLVIPTVALVLAYLVWLCPSAYLPTVAVNMLVVACACCLVIAFLTMQIYKVSSRFAGVYNADAGLSFRLSLHATTGVT